MTERENEDVDVVRELAAWLAAHAEGDVGKRFVRERLAKLYAALDRLQARLKDAEAEVERLHGLFEGARVWMDELTRREAEARADAERLAEAAMPFLDHPDHTSPEVWKECRIALAAALAAHTPHLTSERPPTGTTYVTEEPDGDG